MVKFFWSIVFGLGLWSLFFGLVSFGDTVWFFADQVSTWAQLWDKLNVIDLVSVVGFCGVGIVLLSVANTLKHSIGDDW